MIFRYSIIIDDMQILNEIKLFLKAGHGGKGIVSWEKEIVSHPNKPSGGDGGRGGHIFIIGKQELNNLFSLRNKKNIIACNGSKGATHNCNGTNGDDYFIEVPYEAKVYDENNNLLFTVENNIPRLLCNGGKGGHGNTFFKSK
jgi:GTP-binding protein